MRKATLMAVLLFATAEVVLGWGLWLMFRSETAQVLRLQRQDLVRSYRDVVDGYARLVGVVHALRIDTPGTLQLLADAAEAEPAERDRLRGLLYRRLAPTFALLRTQDVRVLQFVEPDGRSFLRFNRPDLHGDDIAADRPVLASAIGTEQAKRGFENGRVYPGYRYAYPLHLDGRFIGLADYSLSFDALRRVARRFEHTAPAVADDAPATANRLLLRRDLMERVADTSALSLFQPVALHSDYVIEDDGSSRRDSDFAEQPQPWVQALDRKLAHDDATRAAMERGRPLARYACLGVMECATTLLLPILDSEGRVAASFVSYRKAPGYADLRKQFVVAFALSTLMLAFFGFTLRRWLASRQRLRTITEHMGEGLYVMDRKGHILYANPAATELLGYRRNELLGRNAHELIHVHETGGDVPEALCPVQRQPLSGQVYRSDSDHFRRRDGSQFPVSLVASPLHVEGEISGSIVLFRDISADLEAQEQMRCADAAFRNLAEAVVVTDNAARIQAVNQAFTDITGYTEAEILGRDASVLAATESDKTPYPALWQEVAANGSWEGEVWNRRKDGEVYPEWLKITAVRDSSGQIVSFVSVFNDISEARAKEQRLRDLAYYDQLTGLYNRDTFMEMLDEAMDRSRAVGTQLALLYIDLDRFKRINDSLGHAAGDSMLAQAAERIIGLLGTEDRAARFGGDEFVLFMERVERRTVPARMAHTLLERMRQPMYTNGKRIDLSASIGIAFFPSDGADASTLVKHGAAAVFLAKQQGRDGYRYYRAAMSDVARSRFDLEVELRTALREGQLRVHYQPKVSLVDGRVIGLEALVRWQHPSEGLVPPGRFLDVARETGLMEPMTEWVLQEAAFQCRQWRAEDLCMGRISVNLDVGFYQPQALEAMLLQTVRDAGIEPTDLEFEILETAMRDEPKIAELWRRLVAAGFEIAIDDFGTGESSLSRIKQLPCSTLKIDRGFVRELSYDESDRTMTRTIIAMAKSLGKTALAEGVETEEQLRYLMRCGCDAVQGYLLCRPCPADATRAFVQAATSVELVRRLRDEIAQSDGAAECPPVHPCGDR